MILKRSLQYCSFLLILTLFTPMLSAQKKMENTEETIIVTDFSERQAVINTIKNFYIGDHTGSIKHKKLSMHEKGAYRYINNDGEYSEGVFDLDSEDADTNYKEELLSIEIYGKMALARIRHQKTENAYYKLMFLHKANREWKITSITWGFGIIH